MVLDGKHHRAVRVLQAPGRWGRRSAVSCFVSQSSNVSGTASALREGCGEALLLPRVEGVGRALVLAARGLAVAGERASRRWNAARSPGGRLSRWLEWQGKDIRFLDETGALVSEMPHAMTERGRAGALRSY